MEFSKMLPAVHGVTIKHMKISMENSQNPESKQLYGSAKLLFGTFP